MFSFGDQKGMSTVVVITMLMLLSLFTSVGTQLVSKDSEKTSGLLQSERALYAAEGGLRMAQYTLKNSWTSWNNAASFPQTSFAGGSFDATVTDDSDGDWNNNLDSNNKVIVTVQGSMGNATRYIQATVSRYSSAFGNAVYTEQTLNVDGSAHVYGPVTQNGSAIPVLDVAAAIAAARANTSNGFAARPDGNYFQGDFSANPSSLNGVIFIDAHADGSPADVNLSGNVDTTSGSAIFIVMGDVHVSGNVTYDGLIYTTGAVGLDVTLTGNVGIAGGVISSNDVNLSGSVVLEYSQGHMVNSLTTSLFLSGVNPSTQSWAEIFP
ncbi:MAG: hypothetical protein A3I05_08990 [Deltaproteobacteria bacterium RIFCSPLOWO2_02_FULL_44_10]|nr:MAG: hypothetical protein A3C46_08625 [Deltaproteobacteria bacterium RIFCSPHIGHO2_02_FULL_44_16]OGQ45241.1 MAG: hypothetical protein A3I05_08990 [Deltaproteobacteria bacterium RIFCSPLOWO2_02_FULL_44_10]